jgi:arylsulfatase A-like enzyme
VKHITEGLSLHGDKRGIGAQFKGSRDLEELKCTHTSVFEANATGTRKWAKSPRGSIRTAAIIRWPSHVKPNTTSYAMFSIMDFMPTFAHIIGTSMPTDRAIDGVNQSEWCKALEPCRRQCYARRRFAGH